jgi:hypothetical protein
MLVLLLRLLLLPFSPLAAFWRQLLLVLLTMYLLLLLHQALT